MFTSEVHLCLTVGGTDTLKMWLSLVGREAVSEPTLRLLVEFLITSAVVKVVFQCYVNFTTSADLTIPVDKNILPYMLNVLLESLKTVKRLVVDNLCKSSQVRCAVNSAN